MRPLKIFFIINLGVCNSIFAMNPHVQEVNSQLMRYVRNNNHDGVKNCLQQGAEPNWGAGWPLIEASKRGHTEIVATLLKAGAVTASFCLNPSPEPTNIPLEFAANHPDLQTYQVIIDHLLTEKNDKTEKGA